MKHKRKIVPLIARTRRKNETEFGRLLRLAETWPDREQALFYAERLAELGELASQYVEAAVTANFLGNPVPENSDVLQKIAQCVSELAPFFEEVKTDLPTDSPSLLAQNIFRQCLERHCPKFGFC